jgi:thioredoxin reductase (NADPH)
VHLPAGSVRLAGDAVAYKGKYKQIVVACGEAAIASNSAYKFIKEPYWAK